MASGQEDHPDDDEEEMKPSPSAMEEEAAEEDVAEEEEGEEGGGMFHGVKIRRYQRRASFREVRHFPPPIPTLSLGNLPSHMPWLLRRSYENEGWRLVIQEVKVKHHGFFRAYRSNGRLRLHPVHAHFEESPRRPDVPYDSDPPPPQNDHQEQESAAQNHQTTNARQDSMLVSSSSSPMVGVLNVETDSPGPMATDGEEEANSENESDADSCSSGGNASSMNGAAAAVGMAGGCSVASMFQIPIPTIGPVHS